MHPSRLEISIENLCDIEAFYSAGVSGRVLFEIWSRFEAVLTPQWWRVTTEAWGVSLQRVGGSGEAWDELEAAIHAVALRPIAIGDASIVAGLRCTTERMEAPNSRTFLFDKSQYRSDMEAVATAYAAITEGRMLFAKQAVTDAAEPPSILYQECLLRLTNGAGLSLMPADYIPAMERLGLTRAFDREVVGRLVTELYLRRRETLGCNVSALSAINDLWWNSLLSELALDRDLAERLVIEITETAAPPSVDEAMVFVAAVRATGARVALDDYGAGFSSVSYTQPACMDIVKIGGSILDLSVSSGNNVLHDFVLKASVLGRDVVVEGVETEMGLESARRAGAQWFQGYLFEKRPVS